MRPRSLVFRLAVLQQVLAVAIIVAFATSAIWLSARTLDRQEAEYLANAAAQLARTLDRELLEEPNLRAAAASGLEEGVPPGVNLDVYDLHGARILSTRRLTRGSTAGEMREVRVRVPRGAWVVGSMSTRPRTRTIKALSVALVLSALPLLLLVVAASRGLARQALRPLSQMAAQAEDSIARGEVCRLGQPSDPAEIATLADAFNRLHSRLDEILRAEQHFTQDAAHELRTPLTVLSGEIEHALLQPTLPDDLRDGLRHAHDQAGAMSELVDALLFLRRTHPVPAEKRPEFVPVNMSDVVREAARDLLTRSPLRAADLRIEAEDEVLASGHATLLAAAIRNLLANALKFTEPGQAVEIIVRRQASECLVFVDDAGSGIAPADRARVFDPFFRDSRARGSHEGFGLGLAILRRVIRAHGGEASVGESPLGGARFELRLPEWSPND